MSYFAHTLMHLSVCVAVLLAVLPCNVKRHIFCYSAAATGSEIRNKHPPERKTAKQSKGQSSVSYIWRMKANARF